MQDPREIQELMQKGLKELQSMKVRRGVIGCVVVLVLFLETQRHSQQHNFMNVDLAEQG